jgi:serine/threonine-protein kinase
MLSPSGRVVLLDFGLGVFVEEDIVSRITKTDEAPAGGRFTAPELEANPKLLDPKTDVFSLGAVWFTMLCGQTPAGVGGEAVLRAVPSISNGVVELVLRCLALRAVERPTADDLIHELEKLRPAPALAVRHTEEEPEEVIEGEFATFWRDTV